MRRIAEFTVVLLVLGLLSIPWFLGKGLVLLVEPALEQLARRVEYLRKVS